MCRAWSQQWLGVEEHEDLVRNLVETWVSSSSCTVCVVGSRFAANRQGRAGISLGACSKRNTVQSLKYFYHPGEFSILCPLSVERRPSGGCSRLRGSCSPGLSLCLGALDFSALGHEADLV